MSGSPIHPMSGNPPFRRYQERPICCSLSYAAWTASAASDRGGGTMDKLKRLAIPVASLIALAIAAGASWRL